MTRSVSFSRQFLLLLFCQTALVAQVITNEPQNITVNNASTAEFTVGASNAVSYQWQFNGTNLSDGSGISGSSTATLTLENVRSNQMGGYTVVVNNALTSSPPAQLTIVPGTVITFAISGLIGGGTNYIDVQLFDHDKPATVENFLHYVRSGAYSNMFFERDSVNFALQGGVHGTTDRTNTTAPITGWDIASEFVTASNQSPPFPQEVDNEYGVGPIIHNRFGTIAMALGSSTNSATSQFFFNLADNSASLDPQSFTVFGRILDGTNALNYFNGLADGAGIVNNATFLDNGVLQTNPFVFSVLPVNYLGTALPANANLVYCDFLYTNLPLDTTSPTVGITSPQPTVETNAELVTFSGTASDNVGVANVMTMLLPLPAADGSLPPVLDSTNLAVGTTNWSTSFELLEFGFFAEPLPYGTYALVARAQDGEGNLSPVSSQILTNSEIYVAGNGTVNFAGTNGPGATNNPIGYPFVTGSTYQVLAAPGAGATFVNWTSPFYSSISPLFTFTNHGRAFVANFVTNQPGGIAFASPFNDPLLSNNLFSISGTINTGILTPPVTVTAQIFADTNSSYQVSPLYSTVGTNAWSIMLTNYLPTGSFVIQAIAVDALGHTTVVTDNFSFVAVAPSVAITSPAANAVVLNTNTLSITGTATAGSAPLASVNVTLIPVAASDGTVPQGGVTNFTAVGTTNWSVSLSNALGYIPPGQFQVIAQIVDSAGETAQQTNTLSISSVAVNGNGSVILSQRGTAIVNPIGYPLQYSTNYQVMAVPGTQSTFAYWTYFNGANAYVITANPWTNFAFGGGLLTANFVETNTPRGVRGITFVSPYKNEVILTNSLVIRGTVTRDLVPADVTLQVYSLTSGLAAGGPVVAHGTGASWSATFTNLLPDLYGVTATATNGGISAVASEAFYIVTFKAIAGTYNGLFLCTTQPVNATNSGFFTFTLGDFGTYSGKVLMPGYKPIAVADRLNIFGQGQHGLTIPGNTAHMYLQLNVDGGPDVLTGTVVSAANSWSSSLICYRATSRLTSATIPTPGKYVVQLNPTNWGTTNGYASIIASPGGVMSVSGALPDGAAFTESIKTSTNGIFPLYATPASYKSHGFVMGWMTNFASNNVGGELVWAKDPGVGTYFATGVNTNVLVAGTNFTGAAAGNYNLVFNGGTLAAPLTNELSVARQGGPLRVTPASDDLVVSISATGVISGHFTATAGEKPTLFKGIYLGGTNGGSGFILDSGTAPGYFQLQPK
jgi:cyclophilin family peptidyl-prolyl cis-trans isomerase